MGSGCSGLEEPSKRRPTPASSVHALSSSLQDSAQLWLSSGTKKEERTPKARVCTTMCTGAWDPHRALLAQKGI